jgi:AbrB family looped-hinge helix DNA binding protein
MKGESALGEVPTVKELVTVVAKKGHITVPAEVCKALDLKQGDPVAFELPEQAGGAVSMRRVGSVVERTAGIFQRPDPPLDAREERATGEQAWADDVIDRMGQ